MTGVIKSLQKDKGFGFIRVGSVEYFFHRSALQDADIQQLELGQTVTFDATQANKGPRAENIYTTA